MPGRHNVLNALAAIAIATDEGVQDENIVQGLREFEGVGRRFEIHGKFKKGKGDFLLVDDYGHHPSEVKATIEAVRLGWPDQRLIMVYQPHRYSRTLELFDQFVDVLSTVDHLVLLDVYSAGEEPIVGATGDDLYKAIKQKTSNAVDFLIDVDLVSDRLDQLVSDNDFVLTQGAGVTSGLARSLREKWKDTLVVEA